MAIGFGHTVVKMVMVIPLHKFHTLIPEAKVVTVGSHMTPGYMAHSPVKIDRHPVETVDGLTYIHKWMKDKPGKHPQSSHPCNHQGKEEDLEIALFHGRGKGLQTK
jgi:hypothetical protein